MSPEEIILRLDRIAESTLVKQMFESKKFKIKTEQFAFDMLMEMLHIRMDNEQIAASIKALYALHGLEFCENKI